MDATKPAWRFVTVCLWFDADEFRSLDSEAWMRGGCDEAGVGFDAIEIGGIKTTQLSQHTKITSWKLTESRSEGGGAQLELAGESAKIRQIEVLDFSEQAEFIRTVFAHVNVHK